MQKNQNFSVKKSRSGLGLFSAKNFSKGDHIINYSGNLLSHEKAEEKGGRYLFEIDKKVTIDGSDRKNLARYINHSCDPNCEAYIEGNKISIYARRTIQPEEEITINYGKEYFDEFIKPYGCKCNHCLQNH